jgi:hypothetical protein
MVFLLGSLVVWGDGHIQARAHQPFATLTEVVRFIEAHLEPVTEHRRGINGAEDGECWHEG